MKKIVSTLAILALVSCGGNKPEENKVVTDSVPLSKTVDSGAVTVNDLIRFKFDFAVSNIPSPAQIVNDMSTYNLKYDPHMMADITKANTHKTDYSKAVNLGIYNLDLAYAIANGQGSDVLKYLKTSLLEIDALGMKSAFNQFIGKRTETNLNNKDSLLSIIDEMYVVGDKYLRTNQRVETATYIFIGSWIEALHLVCSTADIEKDPIQKARLYKLIWDQRAYLKNINDLLGEFKNVREAADLKKQLNELYLEVEPLAESKDLKTKNFIAIFDKVEGIRKKMLQ